MSCSGCFSLARSESQWKNILKSLLVKFFEDDADAKAYVMMIEPVLASSACEVSSEVFADKLLQELEVLPSGST